MATPHMLTIAANGAEPVPAAVPLSAVADDLFDFERWYRGEHPNLLAALTWVSGNPDVALEATDEAFARALERWERVRAMDSPGGWLYRVGLNLVRRGARRAAREERTVGAHWRPDHLPAPAGEIWAVVQELPPRQRTAVVLRYLLDLREREVAAIMRVSPGTVASTLAAARTRLAAWLTESPSEVTDD